MKLNYKRTILVGFAFFLISAFWQAYDNAIPLTLTNKFGMSQGWSGVIMALDNILAVILLPIFGALSDRCRSPLGRRRPYIFVGTMMAVILMMALPFIAGTYHSNPTSATMITFVAVLGLLLVSMAPRGRLAASLIVISLVS